MAQTQIAYQDINVLYEAYRRNPCETALEAVVAGGELLVRHFARRYGCGCPFDDLCQSGMLGLVKAVRSYDGQAQFSTWASWCVIGEIRHFVRGECAYEVPEVDGNAIEYEVPTAEGTARIFNHGYNESLAFGLKEEDQSFHLRLEDKIALEQAMLKLTKLQKEVIDALFYRGLTQEQEAERLGFNQRKVSRIKTSGLQMLAIALAGPSFKLVDNSKSFIRLNK
jgi:RNA polymerase sigma-B factor